MRQGKRYRKMRRQSIWYRNLHLGEGAVKEEMFLYIRKNPHGQELGWGELQNLRGEQSNKFLEGKIERIHQVVLTKISQPRYYLHLHSSK